MEKECKVLRYRSILLNGEELCAAEIVRKREAKKAQREVDLVDIVAFDDKDRKPDWVYDTPWDTDQGHIKNLENPKL